MTEFNRAEMLIIKAVFEGECSATRLVEGGDYAYVCWNFGLTKEEMEAFFDKILEG